MVLLVLVVSPHEWVVAGFYLFAVVWQLVRGAACLRVLAVVVWGKAVVLFVSFVLVFVVALLLSCRLLYSVGS